MKSDVYSKSGKQDGSKKIKMNKQYKKRKTRIKEDEKPMNDKSG